MATRAGTVIRELHAAALVALPAVLPGTQVVDGPVVSASGTRAWVFVGANDTPGAPGTTVGDGAGVDLPQFVVAPQISIDVTIQTWSGAVDLPGRRDEAELLVEALELLLIPDPAGVVLGLPEIESARLGDVNYTPVQITKGSTITLVATVEVQMRTRTR